MPLSSILTQNAKPKPMVRQTKDTFLKSIERLSSKQRLTQISTAKALGLPIATFQRYVKKYDLKINDYTVKETKDTFLKSIERLSSEQRLTQISTAKALGLPIATFQRYVKKYDLKINDYTVKETKDTFLKSIERLSSEDRLNQNCMAKALGLSRQTFIAKAKKCDITTEVAAEVLAAREEKRRKTLAMLERKEEEKQKRKALQEEKKRKRSEEAVNRKRAKGRKRAKRKEAREQTKSERAVHNALTVLNPNGKTFKICHDHEVNERNKFRTSLLVSEEKTRGLSRVFAECGTELSEFGLCKLEAYPEATSDILTAEMESLVEYLNNPTKATSNVLLVGPKKHIIDPKKLGPLLRRRIEVSKSGKFGETTVITDNVKVQKYDGSGGKHRDRKVTHTIIHHGHKCFLLARVLEKINGGKLKFFRESDGKAFLIDIKKGEFLIMMAHAGLSHHNSEEGLFTIVTDFVLPYDAIRRERDNGGVDGKLEQMIRKFAKDFSQHL